MARSSRTSWWVRGLTVAVVAGMLAAPAPAPAPASASSACDAGQGRADMASAAVAASACRRPVEDLSRRAEASRTTANPDGTATVTSFLEPRWVRRGDRSWVDVDTTLRRSGGVVAPVATTLAVLFSAGGTAPLARLVDGDRELAMTWPVPLPPPTLDGSSAVYAEVYPGVDLRVTATAEGFSEVLVVKTREALRDKRLAKVTFGLSTRDLTVAAGSAGQTEARDSRGRVVFSSPAPSMWDSAGADPAARPVGRGAVGGGATSTGSVRLAPRRAVMQRMLSARSLAVIPVRSILDDPAVRLPVFIDPSWTGHITGNGWKNVSESSPGSTTFTLLDGAGRGDMGSGRTCDRSSGGSCTSPSYRVRSLLTMDLGGVLGKRILRATFNVTQKWSWTCNTPSNERLWLTAAFSSGTSWSNQPGWTGSQTSEARPTTGPTGRPVARARATSSSTPRR